MNRSISWCHVFVVLSSVWGGQAIATELVVQRNGLWTELALQGQEQFHHTEAEVMDARLVKVPDPTMLIALWNEHNAIGDITFHYVFSFDGQSFSQVRRTSYDIKLRYARFDPLQSIPVVPEAMRADVSGQLFIVQFFTQPLRQLREVITRLGGTVYNFLPDNAYVVAMDIETRAQVEALPYVRWVGPYHPAYRLEEFLRVNLDQLPQVFPDQRYNIMVFERAPGQKTTVAQRIRGLGGPVDFVSPGGFLLYAALTPEQLVSAIRWNEVAYIDRWTPAEEVELEVLGDNPSFYWEADFEDVGGSTVTGVEVLLQVRREAGTEGTFRIEIRSSGLLEKKTEDIPMTSIVDDDSTASPDQLIVLPSLDGAPVSALDNLQVRVFIVSGNGKKVFWSYTEVSGEVN